MKPKAKGKPKAERTIDIGKTASVLSPRAWAIGGVVLAVLVVVWFALVPAQWKALLQDPFEEKEAAVPLSRKLTATPVRGAAAPERDIAFIKTVRLQPTRPTRLDTLTAEVEAEATAPQKLTYTYRWRVNDKTVEDARGESLNLSPFKKRDLVTVTVTPYDGQTAGFAVESPVVALHSVPPSLELKAMRQARRAAEPVELQLAGAAPDGERVAYSLEDPRVPGMTIDRQSGKILWVIQPDQKGAVRFGAAVEDDNGTKVTKIFTVTAD